MKKNRNITKMPFSILIVSIVFIFSGTFAFVYKQIIGSKQVVINSGVLDLVLEEENEITISDALPMYDEVGMIQEDAFVFRLVNKTANDTNYILKLQEIETGTLDKSIVKYGLIKERERTIDFVSNIVDGIIDEGIIKGTDTIDYEFRLWIDSSVTSLTQLQSKFLSFKISVDASQEVPKDPSSIEMKLFATENLGNNCKTYDDGVDTFLVGQCSNNYVWYSGKLWRAVLRNNETGAIKMVTDNSSTIIFYNEDNNATYENNYIDQWLNQEFLPTLHDYENYLVVDSLWDTTANLSDTPTRSSYTTSVTRTVGLLNVYEYYTTYNNSSGLANKSTGYLNNEIEWWLLTPQRMVNSSGSLGTHYSKYPKAIRPSINMDSNIQISSGTGILSNPYILEGDERELVEGVTLLSTRYSGEYVTFNNELYRIVDIENGLVKITAVDKPTSLLSNKFNSSSGYGSAYFASSSIKTDLENYYQGLKLTNETAYNMIEPNTTWYYGNIEHGMSYKAGICATVDANTSMKNCENKARSTIANIGLPRIGEMFTSQITRGAKEYFFTSISSYEPNIWVVNSKGNIIETSATNNYGARPSMYLKSNIVIASDNTGNGTYEHPYKIELGS